MKANRASRRPLPRRRGQALLEFLAVVPVLLLLFAVYLSYGKGFILKQRCRAAARYAAAAKAAGFQKTPGITEAECNALPGKALQQGLFFVASGGSGQPSLAVSDTQPPAGPAGGNGSTATALDSVFSMIGSALGALGGIVSSITNVVLEPSGQAYHCCGTVSNVQVVPLGARLSGFGTQMFSQSYYVPAGQYTRNEMSSGSVLKFIPVASALPSINLPLIGSLP